MAGNNTKIVIKNLGMQIVQYCATFILGIVTSRIILLEYGSEINGLLSSINQFISYINLVELGLTSSAVYALYQPLANKDNKLLNEVLSATNLYYRKTGYVFSVLIIVLCVSYPLFTNASVITPFGTAYLVLALGATGVINYFISAKYRILLIADQRQYVLASIGVFSLVLNTCIVYIFGSVLHCHITTLRTICILTSLIPAIVITVYTRYLYKSIKFENKKVKADIIKNRYVVFVNEIAGNLHFGSPMVILTFIVDLLEVSVYSVFNVVCNGISSLLNSTIVPISATFGSLLAKKEYRLFQQIYSEFESVFYLMSAAIFAISYKILLPFVLLYTQGVYDVNYNRPLFISLMVGNMFVCNLYSPQAILVRATGFFKEIQPQTLIQAACTIALGIPLTYLWGINGVVVASICANTYRSVAMILFFNNKVQGVNSKNTLLYIVESVFVFLISIYLIDIIDNLSFLDCRKMMVWVMYSFRASVVSFGVAITVLFVFHRKIIMSLINRFR